MSQELEYVKKIDMKELFNLVVFLSKNPSVDFYFGDKVTKAIKKYEELLK